VVNLAPTIGGVEWASAVGWHRRSGRAADPGDQRLAADTLGALSVGVVVLDPSDQPVLVNATAVELGDLAAPDLGEGAVGGQHLARYVDRALSAGAGAELDGQELGVGEGLGTVPVEPLARPLGPNPLRPPAAPIHRPRAALPPACRARGVP